MMVTVSPKAGLFGLPMESTQPFASVTFTRLYTVVSSGATVMFFEVDKPEVIKVLSVMVLR